jgi:DNA-binding HxlR family transcriptional regulator
MVTITDNQKLRAAKKIEELFGHINPKDPPEYCPIRDVMATASDKWSILIILYLGYYPVLRFNMLKNKVYGISNKVLSERLKTLERDGYVCRNVFPEVPVRVEYGLTDFGHSYLEQVLRLSEWANTYAPLIMDKRKKGKKLKSQNK